MHTDEQFVMWLQGLSPKTKVGNPRLAENCPELRFLRALGINVLLVGVHEITTLDHERIQCRWIEEFHKNLLAKFFPEESRLREVTAQQCLSVLRPDEPSPTA